MTENLSDAEFVADIPAEIVGNLKSSILWTSGELKDNLTDLLFVAIRYNSLADAVYRNASAKISLVTNKEITNDFSLILIVDDHQNLLADANLLAAACDIAEMARNVTAHYKLDSSHHVAQLVETLIPNVDGLNEKLITLARQLRLFDAVDIAKGREELRKMTDELQTANNHIETNIDGQIILFEKQMIEVALRIDAALKHLSDKLEVILQLPVNEDAVEIKG